jgi:hypothetical protein
MQVTPTDNRAFKCVDDPYLRVLMAGVAVAGIALNANLPDAPAAFPNIDLPKEQESYPISASKMQRSGFPLDEESVEPLVTLLVRLVRSLRQ